MGRVLLMFCDRCKEYTMQENACPRCEGKVRSNRPGKYSPEDHYGKYRRLGMVQDRDAQARQK